MNRQIKLCGVLAAMLLALGSVATARTWIDATGQFNVDGEFVSIDGSAVRIKTAEGKIIAIPLEKLSKDDQKFVENLKKAAAAANPFAAVPKDDSKAKAKADTPAPPVDPALETSKFLKGFRDRVLKAGADESISQETEERKKFAHEKMHKELTDEVNGKPLTFRFPIVDITFEGNHAKELSVVNLKSAEGFAEEASMRVRDSFSLPLSRADALAVAKGDILVLAGKAICVSDNPRIKQRSHTVTGLEVVDVQGPGYGFSIRLQDYTFKIEHVSAASGRIATIEVAPTTSGIQPVPQATVQTPQPPVVPTQHQSPSPIAPLPPTTPEKIVSLSDRQEDALVLGNLRKGTKLTIQYVSGKWKDWGHSATENPDTDSPERGDECRVAIANHPIHGPSTVLALVPAGTAARACEWVCPNDLERVTLRINSKLGDYAKHPGGVVRYKLTIAEPEPTHSETSK